MPDIEMFICREVSSKKILAWSMMQFPFIPDGQEQIQVSIPEVDHTSGIYTKKYRCNPSTGDLEINGKEFLYLEVDDQAVRHSGNGVPQVIVGSGETFNVVLKKKDLQGNYYNSIMDNDTVYVAVYGGVRIVPQFSLAYGQATISCRAGNKCGITRILLTSDDMRTTEFSYETIEGE